MHFAEVCIGVIVIKLSWFNHIQRGVGFETIFKLVTEQKRETVSGSISELRSVTYEASHCAWENSNSFYNW